MWTSHIAGDSHPQPAPYTPPMPRPKSAASIAAKRAVIRLQLEVEAKRALDDLCDARGMTQIAVLSRVVKWFVAQDEVVQASVLGLMSQDYLGDLSQILLKRLASDGAAGARGGR